MFEYSKLVMMRRFVVPYTTIFETEDCELAFQDDLALVNASCKDKAIQRVYEDLEYEDPFSGYTIIEDEVVEDTSGESPYEWDWDLE